jgi:hypothetical protein
MTARFGTEFTATADFRAFPLNPIGVLFDLENVFGSPIKKPARVGIEVR